MKKKISLFAISIFMLGTVFSVNAETKATDNCMGVHFSCGKTGQVCQSGATEKQLIALAHDINDIIC